MLYPGVNGQSVVLKSTSIFNLANLSVLVYQHNCAASQLCGASALYNTELSQPVIAGYYTSLTHNINARTVIKYDEYKTHMYNIMFSS